MKITLFGGSGFVGGHVAEALHDAGHRVHVFDLKPSSRLRPG
ncbi:MAG TPA: NAD-dependent epimerase/dehydratase family protein, partial [Elusimicrobiota bacterium]|nr:NAD-dependent epimerase/dehydratase family protein [Elusimicrobiota bacterium]